MDATAPAVATVYDCQIQSGGGAKGAYGAGVAKGIDTYRRHKKITNPVLYAGASAGALNAYILASRGPDQLIEFWLEVSRLSVLGTNERPTIGRLIKRVMARGRGPFSIYDNVALKALIREHAHVAAIVSPLVLACTDYTEGKLKAFYCSDLIERLVAEDENNVIRARRFAHLRKIETDDTLVDALLASAAIPVVFPPVKITTRHAGVDETSWFIDGGVGNNTPTREAAYFFRFLEKLNLGVPGTGYCVNLDPLRVFQGQNAPLGIFDIIMRTLDVFNYVHTTPIVDAWNRINREVDIQVEKVRAFTTWLAELPIDVGVRQAIEARLYGDFARLGGSAPRISTPMIGIGPTHPLGDFLDFSTEAAEGLITHGYSDAIRTLGLIPDPARGGEPMLDEGETRDLLNRRIW